MSFSPQRRAILRHPTFEKCSEDYSLLACSLQNVLFATAACNFWCLLSAPTSAPAALTGLLFHWPDTRILEKTQHFATSLTFGADVSSFFWLSRYCIWIFFLLTWLFYSAFQLSILSEVSIKTSFDYSVLQSLLQYYSVLQSTTPVLLRTTKYYSSTTKSTPVLLRTTKYYSSTNKVLQSKYCACHEK